MDVAMEANNTTQSGPAAQCTGELSTQSQFAVASLNAIAGIIAMFGNTLVLTAIYRTPSLRTVSNAFVASLAVSDFYIGLVIHTVWMARAILNVWQSDQLVSEVVQILSLQSLIASAYNLCAIAIDRYISIASVFQSQDIITPKRCAIIISCIWFFSVAFATTRLFFHDPQILPYLWFTVQFLGILLPLNIIAYCYFRIFKIARQQKKKIAAENIKKDDTSFILRNNKAAWTAGIIIGLFVVLGIPNFIIASVQSASKDPCFKIEMIRVWFWTAFIAFSSAACHPWIYALRNKDFRRAFSRIFRRSRVSQINFRSNNEKSCCNRSEANESCWLKCRTCVKALSKHFRANKNATQLLCCGLFYKGKIGRCYSNTFTF